MRLRPSDGNPPGDFDGYRSLDKRRYLSVEQLEAERERVWLRTWQLAGLVVDLPAEGSYFTFELGHESVLVVRGADRTRAFHNVCPHRGRALRDPGSGMFTTIRCPYHHWEWSLDGSMRNMPCAEDFGALGSRTEPRLQELACAEWQGFVWVHFGASPGSLEGSLGAVGERLARYRLSEYSLRSDQTVEIPCNWKVAIDASNENYHIPAVHPELLQVYDEKPAPELVIDGDHAYGGAPFATPSSNAKDREKLNPWLRQWVVEAGLDPADFETRATEVRRALQLALRARSTEFDFGELTDDELLDYYSYFFFPNVHFNVQGRELNVSRARPHPTDPGRMWLDQWTFERKPRGAPIGPRAKRESFQFGEGSLGFVTDQDTATYVRVQRGLRSSGIDRIRLGDREERIRHMHATLDRYMAVDPA